MGGWRSATRGVGRPQGGEDAGGAEKGQRNRGPEHRAGGRCRQLEAALADQVGGHGGKRRLAEGLGQTEMPGAAIAMVAHEVGVHPLDVATLAALLAAGDPAAAPDAAAAHLAAWGKVLG